MKAAGLPDLTVDELIAMKIQDVTPEYVKELHAQGLHPDANSSDRDARAGHHSGIRPRYSARPASIQPRIN